MVMTDETELHRLIVVPNGEGGARAELAGGVDRPYQVRAARAALARLDAPSLRAALEGSRSVRGLGSAQ
jgi:hypothetical protein